MNRVAMSCTLPVRQGTASRPALELQSRPFTPVESATGLVSQVVDEAEAAAVYADTQDTFSIPPRGTSTWATSLSAPYLAFLHECVAVKGTVSYDIGGASTYFAENLTAGPSTADAAIVIDPGAQASSSDRIRVVRDWWQVSTRRRHGLPDPDLVISTTCLEHVPDVTQFLSACCEAVAAKQCDLILISPAVDSQLRTGDWNALLDEHIPYFTIETARGLLQSRTRGSTLALGAGHALLPPSPWSSNSSRALLCSGLRPSAVPRGPRQLRTRNAHYAQRAPA